MGWMLAILIALWLFLAHLFLIAPSFLHPKLRTRLLAGPYAHRGLHGKDAPENSLAAFQLAVKKGYGIELDVHWTRDGNMVVHHDDSLLRTCGVDRKIQDMDLQEIRACRLLGTQARVPTLDEALDVIGGKVPLIVEMKSDPAARKKLPEALMHRMRAYPGIWCVESFDPLMVRWYKKHAPNVIRGQLAYDPYRLPGDAHRGVGFFLGARLLMNCLSRPDFVAYGYKTASNGSLRLMRKVFHPVMAAWTIQTPADYERLQQDYEILIFEGFEPPISSLQSH